MGGDSAYNGSYVQATKLQSDSNEAVADTQGEWDYKVAVKQSEAVMKQAELDYKARIYEADSNERVQIEALRVREKEAENQLKVDMANAKNDAIRAEASMVTAQASIMKAETKQFDAESKRERDHYKYGSSQGSDYFYGNA